MPVLSETTASSSLPGLDLPYVLVGGSVLLLLGVLISRKSKKSPPLTATKSPELPEKSPMSQTQEPLYSPNIPMPFSQHQHYHPTLLARPSHPLPFTPPTLSTTIFPAPPPPPGPFTSTPSSPGLNASYYSSPITLEFDFPSTSPTNPSEPPALSTTPQNQHQTSELPRRRSYTKSPSSPPSREGTGGSMSSSSSSSVTVTGEIVSAEGWRRHTRVFGGGVCKACEESERRMSA